MLKSPIGLSVSYDELLRHHNDLANYVVESSEGHVHVPSTFDPSLFTFGFFITENP
jgi:hypothetical protein